MFHGDNNMFFDDKVIIIRCYDSYITRVQIPLRLFDDYTYNSELSIRKDDILFMFFTLFKVGLTKCLISQ